MPEGPEVKIIAEELCNYIKGSYLLNIEIIDGPYKTNNKTHFKRFRTAVKNTKKILSNNDLRIKILDVNTRGKWIYINLGIQKRNKNLGVWKPNNKIYLFNHLGMAGHWRKEKTKHTLFKMKTSVGNFYFDDARRFGKFDLLNREQALEKLDSLGPDVLEPEFTLKAFQKRLKVSRFQNKPIVQILLDQSFISGVGNIYRSDALYKANIHPMKLTKNLSPQEIKRLYKSIKSVIQKSYNSHGTTISTYSDIEMNPGYYEPLVYGRKKDNLGRTVKTKKVNGRSIFWVPENQK